MNVQKERGDKKHLIFRKKRRVSMQLGDDVCFSLPPHFDALILSDLCYGKTTNALSCHS